MTTQRELQEICNSMIELLYDNDLTNSEALEIAVNFYGAVCIHTGVTVHDAVSGIMTYYKSYANR